MFSVLVYFDSIAIFVVTDYIVVFVVFYLVTEMIVLLLYPFFLLGNGWLFGLLKYLLLFVLILGIEEVIF